VVRTEDNGVRFALSRGIVLTEDGYGVAPEVDTEAEWEVLDLELSVSRPPEIVEMTVDVDGQLERALAVIYVDAGTSEYRWMVRTTGDPIQASSWMDKGPLLDTDGDVLLADKASDEGVIGGRKPAATSVLVGGIRRGVGAFVDGQNQGHVYAYVAEEDRWLRQLGLGTLRSEPSIAIGHQRVGTPLVNGQPATALNTADLNVGRIYVAYKVKSGDNTYPVLYMSKNFELGTLTEPAATNKDRAITLGTVWSKTIGSTGIDIYQDAFTASLRGTWLARRTDDDDDDLKYRTIELLPFADGTRGTTLTARSDFEFMERHVCMGVRSVKGDGADVCGTADDTQSGL
ncbi:MAG TPA: hypothetical protein VF989_18395, partial [Polyangiaceae bacterium]